MDDQLIIQLFNKRSERAIAAINEKYGKMCKAISYRILKNEQDAEECVNDVYLVAWNTIPPETPNPLSSYIGRVARNLSLKRYRHNTAQKRNNFYDASLEEIEECICSTLTSEKGIEEHELTNEINSFLAGVKKIDRVIFMKRYWFCYEIAEIAEEMDLSTNYVNVHLHRTKEKLKKYLIKENFYE